MCPTALKGNIWIDFRENRYKSHPSICTDNLAFCEATIIEIGKESSPLGTTLGFCNSEVYDLFLSIIANTQGYKDRSFNRTCSGFSLDDDSVQKKSLKPCCDPSSMECVYCIIQGFCYPAYGLRTYSLSQDC